MKIKVRELLNRKEHIKRQKELLDALEPCASDKILKTLHIDSDDVEAVEATLEEYEELLDALIESAEVNV